MASKFARGRFTMTQPEKYVGNKVPIYRSSWEWSFMRFCDTNEHIQKWASEAIQIPYRDPLTGKGTIYVPDFFIQYLDKRGKLLVELLERVGKNKYNQQQFVKNQAKWAAANIWCRQQGIKFRILNENDLFSHI